MNKKPYFVTLFTVACIVLYFLIPQDRLMEYLTSPMILVYAFSFKALGKAALASLLHHGFSHLLGNLTIISLMGVAIEKKIGTWKMFLLMLVTGIFALALHVGYMPFSPVMFLGASGYAFGLLVVYVFLL